MAVNRTKVLEAAQKFQSKGQYDKAIAEYQKLVAEDPRDVRTLLKIGDLHTKRAKPKDAIDVYLKVAELYAKQGFFLKAVAVYKQILKLDPAHIDSSQKLAKMYEELALTSDALNTYEQVADAYLAQGQTDKALETMARMVELDGQNVAVRIKYAEALSKAEKTKEAAKAFAEGAHLLKEQGRMDDYIRVVERQLYHDADNLELARNLSGLYLERQDPKRALAKLQICFKADPRDVQTLEMLAEAFRQLGQIPKTVSVLKEISRLQAEFGATEARRRTLQRVLDLDPNDAEARQGLGPVAAPAPTQAQRTAPAAQPLRLTQALEQQADRSALPAPQAARGTQADRMSPAPAQPRATQAERVAPAPAQPQRGTQADRMAPSPAVARGTQAERMAPAPAPAQPQRTLMGMAPTPGQLAPAPAPVAKSTRAPSSFPPMPEMDAPEVSVDDGSEYDLLEGSDDEDLLSDDNDDGDLDEVLIVDDRTDHHPEPEVIPQRAQAAAAAAATTARQQESKQERMARLLSDADAHEGYGLYDKVEALLKEVLGIDPDHVPTRERLKDLYVATDRRVEAARELLWLSDVWTLRNQSRAIQYARDAYELAPHAAATKSRLAALGVNPEQESAEDVMFVEDSKPSRLTASEAERRAGHDKPTAEAARAAAPSPVEEEDPLDIPISPDEFDSAPPSQSLALHSGYYAELLDEEMSPEDFDREDATAATAAPSEYEAPLDARGLDDDNLDNLLDAPISPDEFDAPPPRRSMVGPSDVGELLDRPQPDDDFGLSDERFDRSGLIDSDATEIGDAVEIRAAVAQSVAKQTFRPAAAEVPDDDEPSVEFVEIGTGEIDVADIGAAEAELDAQTAPSEAGSSESFAELGTGEIEFDARTARGREAAPAVPPPRKPSVQDLPPLPPVAARKTALPDLPPLAPAPVAAPAPTAARAAPVATPTLIPSEAPLSLPPDLLDDDEPSTSQDAGVVFVDEADAGPERLSLELDAAPSPAAETAAVAAAPDIDSTPEIEETLDEADFFASQGMMDEAVELVQEAILIYPGSKALRAKMLEYEAAADAQEAHAEAEADAKKAGDDDSFDIAEQLAETPGTSAAGAAPDEMVDVESVFAQFKKGVSEQIDLDDSETHFDLGIAYKEMGLTKDAMAEFEIASRGAKRACAALTMIGTCALEQGDAQRAVDQFNRALATDHKAPGEELALQYEIGNAYELLGQVDRAIKAFEQAAMRDRSFRGVGQRLDQLKRRRGSSLSDDAEVDAALDELLGS